MKIHRPPFLTLFLTVCLFITGISGIKGQQFHVNAQVDSNSILIGSPFHYKLKVKHSNNSILEWPAFEDSLGAFEILEQGQIDSSKTVKGKVKTQTLKVTSFKPGKQVLPALTITSRQKGDTTIQTLQTDTFQVHVQTMAVDTSKAIKPVKEIYDIPLTFAELWPYLAVGLGIILLILLGVWLYRRWKQKPQEKPERQLVKAPHEIAIEKLEKLKSQQLWQQGYIKEYHDQLTDILRAYLEKVFQIRALELTTGEIMEQLKQKPLSPNQKDQLKEIFETADLAKFAKANPSPEENQKALDVAFDFIRETKGPKHEEDAMTNKT